ncbi:ribosome silencing factor [Aestuariivita boseongensis]|uniref:ribosome silencing factor n=1 Tax=Aestuariivita boseongensis TaxID=1470562 RepID=UPI0009E19E39|nr:ribosome silencing factor [Aestuariivita boseongensis]
MDSAGSSRRAAKEDIVLSIHAEAAQAADDRASHSGAGPAQPTSETLLATILSQLSDDKAEEIVEIDLRGKSAIGDYMVICSGRSTRQVSAIAEKLVDRLKTEFGRLSRVEGKDAGDWVLIDTGDVIVHIFRPEVREFYQLEKMWVPATAQAN